MVHTHLDLAETSHYSSQRSPDEAKFRDGNFDRWDVDQGISVEWKMRHSYAPSKNVENQVV